MHRVIDECVLLHLVSRKHVYLPQISFVNSDQCKEPLLSEKQSSHRVTSACTRLRAISEVPRGNIVMGTSSATDTSMAMVTGIGLGTVMGTVTEMGMIISIHTNECIVSNVVKKCCYYRDIEYDTDAAAAAADKLIEQKCVEVPIFDEGTTDSGRLPDVVAESKIYGVIEDEPLESYLAITIQVFIPFLIAGLGMVGAGLVFDSVHVR